MFSEPINCLCPALLLVSFLFSVLMLFLIPTGNGSVLLARNKGIAWPVTAGLYLVSDVILVVACEPIFQFIAWLGGKASFLARVSAGMKDAMACTTAPFSGTGAGIAITNLRFSKYFHNPDTAMWIVLGAMIALPVIIRLFRGEGMGHESRDGI